MSSKGGASTSGMLGIRTRRAAYVALAVLTLIWGSNWLVMKTALAIAHPVVLNLHRTWLAIAFLFVLMIWQRRLRWPTAWWPIAVTGFFQTTVNYGSTTMALAEGGAGRTSVLVFTMPFWTLLIARFVLHERVRGGMWFAVAFAFAGLTLVVEPWRWEGQLASKLWAVASGFGWAAGAVATKYYQRRNDFDVLNFMAWQMLVGVLPLSLLPLVIDYPATQWSVVYAGLVFYIGLVSTGLGFILWAAILGQLPAGTASLNMFAIPVIALVSSMIVMGERLTASEWWGIAAIAVGLATLTVIALRAAKRGEQAAPTPPTPLEGGD